jgi:hypothetical protein
VASWTNFSLELSSTPVHIKLRFKGLSDSLETIVLQILEKFVEFDPLANQEHFNNVYKETL